MPRPSRSADITITVSGTAGSGHITLAKVICLGLQIIGYTAIKLSEEMLPADGQESLNITQIQDSLKLFPIYIRFITKQEKRKGK